MNTSPNCKPLHRVTLTQHEAEMVSQVLQSPAVQVPYMAPPNWAATRVGGWRAALPHMWRNAKPWASQIGVRLKRQWQFVRSTRFFIRMKTWLERAKYLAKTALRQLR
ncbi:MAG: hypothetical protein KGZ83_18735 [Sulfuricella sp.]|nr:hypothetical protein [Sulfuricella sp.]